MTQMDTPTIAAYYREQDPMKRKALLEESIQAGEDPEGNAIRKEIWNIRYQGSSDSGNSSRADGYLGLWMVLEFNRDAARKMFGIKGARKEINKHLDKLKFEELRSKGPQYEELLYRECCHMVKLYMELCAQDRTYNTVLCGIMSMSNDKSKQKLKKDIYETAVALPPSIHMEKELGMITRAAMEMYEVHFPGEGALA